MMKKRQMRKTKRAVLFLLAAPCFADTSIVSIETSQMQAKITVRTDQPGFCTYRASRGTTFSSDLQDLVNNGNTDARPGSIIHNLTHIFIVETRKGDDSLAMPV